MPLQIILYQVHIRSKDLYHHIFLQILVYIFRPKNQIQNKYHITEFYIGWHTFLPQTAGSNHCSVATFCYDIFYIKHLFHPNCSHSLPDRQSSLYLSLLFHLLHIQLFFQRMPYSFQKYSSPPSPIHPFIY